ncbi:MAG: 3-isopropylmalate dehydratase large subunit [Pseudomonadota bacterium]
MAASAPGAASLYDKVWRRHVVVPETDDAPAVLYIDLHLVHEVTSPQAFQVLRERGLTVRRPDRTLATADHSTPTDAPSLAGLRQASNPAARQVQLLEANCREFGIDLHSIDSPSRGIVHVIGPELGATQPGKTIVCGDSHTSTHGAFGALAFGIGTTEVGHVLATQCLLQRKARSMAVNINGKLADGVGAKDVTLAVIGAIGVAGGTGHVLEYRGDTVRAMSMEQRMTLCNMSIEAGARAGMVAPDDTTFEYLAGRPMVPRGEAFDAAVADWRGLAGDAGAAFDSEASVDASSLEPMITYGTNPGMVLPITATVPDQGGDAARRKALDYMGLSAGEPLIGKPVNVVFVGSCTNSRLSDLRDAARVMRGRRVSDGVRMLVVPGSQDVKRQAEAEGLHEVFLAAGADWRESGCSMCIAMNGDSVAAGEYSVSTSNRNFEGRQGAGARTLLASPATAAAAAVTGHVADPRPLLG